MQSIHLLYLSNSTTTLDAPSLGFMIDRARRFNAAHDITGILLRCGAQYFQLLEGPLADVDALYGRIRLDSRHDRVTLLARAAISRRAYEGWSMSLAEASPREFAEATGLTQPLEAGAPRIPVDASSLASNVLHALHRNRHWRIQGEPRA